MALKTNCLEIGNTKKGVKENCGYAKAAECNWHRINLTVYNRAKLMTTF